MPSEAPRAFNRHVFTSKEQVYYGTDDGYHDGSFKEFETIQNHYQGVAPERRENIHMISVIGGLYGLNILPLWQPKRLTVFDINPHAVAYFHIIRHVLMTSKDAEHFLNRLTLGDYQTTTDEEAFIKENISLKQKGLLTVERGASERSFQDSWKYALDHFEITKQVLCFAQLDVRTEPMESGSFREFIRTQNNLWIYASNITQFHFFDLEFEDPSNVVLLGIHHDTVQLLDLAPLSGNPLKVKCELEFVAEPLSH